MLFAIAGKNLILSNGNHPEKTNNVKNKNK